MKKTVLLAASVFLVALGIRAFGDYTATQGAGSTVFAFVCSTTKICPATVNINSSNTEIFTSANPGLVSVSQGGNTAVVKAGNTAATTDVAVAVADPNVLAAVQAAQPAGTNRIGYTSDDPCANLVKVTSPISVVSPTGFSVIAAGVTAQKTYVCTLVLFGSAGATVSVTEGTGNACAGGTVALAGSTTAAGGMSFPASGGLANGAGSGTVMATKTNADNLCLYGFTGTIAGYMTLIQQ